MHDGRSRAVIERVIPEVDGGRFPIKRVVGEEVSVSADILADGHDVLAALLLYRGPHSDAWAEQPLEHRGNDRWEGCFVVERTGTYRYTVEAWVDSFRTWQHEFRRRQQGGQDLRVHLLVGAALVQAALGRASEADRAAILAIPGLDDDAVPFERRVEAALDRTLTDFMDRFPDRQRSTRYERELLVTVERHRALFSTWYERFPRSCSPTPGHHGTLRDMLPLLPEIQRMGFDVLYLPPIHPIGEVNRKGRNNNPAANPGDVGSPWAIGSPIGGHRQVHPELGSVDDVVTLCEAARTRGIEIAMDIAFQCAPDHPYVKEHPEWFRWLPDGTVQHAENPPKKYEDILPFNFECDGWEELWAELADVVLFWAAKGVSIFRVDNPHTKPFRFWEWLISRTREKFPDVLFLSEAFTRPKVMYQLAKAGFAQSYTYFTWRNTKPEFQDYIAHLLTTEVREFFRPNFWPNTPDILPEHLQYGGRPAFMMRLILAATLSSNYGIYGPAFELCVAEGVPGREEYMDSEKYEIKSWDWDTPGNLKDLIARINTIRRENPALQSTWNLRFYDVDNEYLLAYGKTDVAGENQILVVVNLDPAHTQSGWITLPTDALGIAHGQSYLVHDLLGGERHIWHGDRNFVQIDPQAMPAQIFRIRRRMKRETDFDYYF